ncbi:MAG: FrgA protein, partial [Myxococcaceae bacterium]
KEITRNAFGPQPRRWTEWWAMNRERRRVQWLVAALRSPELDLRHAAVDELSRAVSDTLGFNAEAPEVEREAAVRRWEQLVQETPRGRRLEL